MDQEDTNPSLKLQRGSAGLELNMFSCRWPRTVRLQSQTASPLSTSPAWSEFPEVIMIQEKKEAQEYQAHAQRTKRTNYLDMVIVQ